MLPWPGSDPALRAPRISASDLHSEKRLRDRAALRDVSSARTGGDGGVKDVDNLG